MKPHLYDGTLNDGFCGECGLRRDEGLHTREPWEEAWERSRRIQQARLHPPIEPSHTEAPK